MARYPQGVSTFIPQIQPYQVDFNFVNNILQAKQNQYDQNWKQLNKLYGQIYYADLTHNESKAKQKAIVNEIDFNLKRVAGLDLSLDQNVQAAQQVFQPFYQDTNLMKDMAWTKNTKAQLNTAEALRSSSEEDRRAQYWRTGIDAINYKMQEFQETPYDQIQSIGNVKYTPYVDVMKKAEQITKEYGDTVTPSFEGGKWIVKTTNGEQLIEPLSNLLNIRLGGDPFVKDMYQTQSYVQRKNYINSEAGNFGGDKIAAERAYLQDGYERMRNNTIRDNQRLQVKSNAYDEQIKSLEKKQKENPGDPEVAAAIRELVYNKSVIDENLAASDKLVESYNNGSSNGTTSTGEENPFENIDVLRRRVDSLVANDLFNRDVNQAAMTYAYRNYKQDIVANPYGLADYQSQLRMKEKKYEADRAEKLKMDELKLETGDFRLQVNPDGTTKVVPKDERFFPQAEMLTDPGFTSDGNIIQDQQSIVTDIYRDDILPSLNTQLNTINQSSINNKESYFEGQDLNELVKVTQSVEAFDKALKEGKIKGASRSEALHNLKLSLDSFYDVTSNRQVLLDTYPGREEDLMSSFKQIHDYDASMQAYDKWNKKAMASVAQDAMNKGNSEVAALVDKNGETRTLKQWAQQLQDEGKITEDTKNKLIASGGSATYKKPFTKAVVPVAGLYGQVLDYFGIDPWGGGQGLIPNFGPEAASTERLKDVNGNDIIGYKEANEEFKNYKIDYKTLGPSPILSGQVNPGDPTDLVNIQGSSVVIAGEGGGYERFGKDIFRDLDSVDIGGGNAYGTFNSPAFKGGYAESVKATLPEDRSKHRAILNYIEQEMQNDDSKVEFKVVASPIAAQDPNKAAMTFHSSDPDFWDKLVSKKDKSGSTTTPGIITADEAAKLKANGYSIVADRSQFTNDLLAHSTKGAVLTTAETDPDGNYSYTNPFDPKFKTNVKLNKQTNNVGMTYQYPLFDAQTLDYGVGTFEEPIINPGNLDTRVETINTYQFTNKIRQQNAYQANLVQQMRAAGIPDDQIRQEILRIQQDLGYGF